MTRLHKLSMEAPNWTMLGNNTHINIYIYICVCVCVYIYIEMVGIGNVQGTKHLVWFPSFQIYGCSKPKTLSSGRETGRFSTCSCSIGKSPRSGGGSIVRVVCSRVTHDIEKAPGLSEKGDGTSVSGEKTSKFETKSQTTREDFHVYLAPWRGRGCLVHFFGVIINISIHSWWRYV